MYISVLVSDLKNDPWIAVQWNDDLDSLLDDNTYNAAATKTFQKNDGDKTERDKISILDNVSGNWAVARVIQLVRVAALVETVSKVKELVKSSKPVTTAPTKEVAKSRREKPATKKSVRKVSKKALQKSSSLNKVAKKSIQARKAPKKAANKIPKKNKTARKAASKKKPAKKSGKKS